MLGNSVLNEQMLVDAWIVDMTNLAEIFKSLVMGPNKCCPVPVLIVGFRDPYQTLRETITFAILLHPLPPNWR